MFKGLTLSTLKLDISYNHWTRPIYLSFLKRFDPAFMGLEKANAPEGNLRINFSNLLDHRLFFRLVCTRIAQPSSGKAGLREGMSATKAVDQAVTE